MPIASTCMYTSENCTVLPLELSCNQYTVYTLYMCQNVSFFWVKLNILCSPANTIKRHLDFLPNDDSYNIHLKSLIVGSWPWNNVFDQLNTICNCLMSAFDRAIVELISFNVHSMWHSMFNLSYRLQCYNIIRVPDIWSLLLWVLCGRNTIINLYFYTVKRLNKRGRKWEKILCRITLEG